MNDTEAIQAIHRLLDGKEWSADMLDDIAMYVRQTDREIREFTPIDERSNELRARWGDD